MSTHQRNASTTTATTLLMWLLWSCIMACLLLLDLGSLSTLPDISCSSPSLPSELMITEPPLTNKQQALNNKSTSSMLSSLETTKTSNNDVDIRSATKGRAHYNGPETTYQVYPHPFPCFPAETDWEKPKTQRSPSQEGIIYTRSEKTASTTFAGVLLGLATKNSPRTPSESSPTRYSKERRLPCKNRLDHSSGYEMQYENRTKSKSFHVSLLRHPTTRLVSDFFHWQVSYEELAPSDENFLSFIQDYTKTLSNYYTKDLSIREITLEELEYSDNYDDEDKTTNNIHHQIVHDILDEYDFIAITERMDESLVVLKHLLDIDSLEDMLYISTTKAGSFVVAEDEDYCMYLRKPFLTDGMQTYFSSDSWKKEYVGVDFLLYNAAIASLDNTIDALGRETIEKEVAEFQRMLQVAEQKCAPETRYRCDAAGERNLLKDTTCSAWGIGCSNDCFETLRGSDWDELYRDVVNR